jgi:Bacterial Ig-like domain (group 1)/PKD domain
MEAHMSQGPTISRNIILPTQGAWGSHSLNAKSAITVMTLLFSLAIPAASASAQTLGAATVLPGQTSLTLQAGNSVYIYGMATGGLFASSDFSQGSVQQLMDASGELVANLAVTANNSNSFTTGADFYTIGGVGVSGFTNMAESFGSNNSPGAPSASDTFTVTQSSLVVVVAMAGGQSFLTLSGVPGLQIDSQLGSRSGGVIGMVIAHASLSPGTYTVTENSFPSPAPGQDPNHMADLVGVFVFSGPPKTVNLGTPCVNGLQVDINGAASPGASVTSISWNWGDGSTTTGFFPQTHKYSAAGQYSVQVTAHYNDGSTVSSSQVVNVAGGFLSNCMALTILAGPFGSVAYQSSVGSGTVPASSSVTLQLDFADDLSLTENPSAGFLFSKWSASRGITGINGAPINSTSPSINIVVASAGTIGATFAVNVSPSEQIPTTVALSANPSSVAESTNTPATITATVLDQNGNAVPGTSVTFATTAGTLLSAGATTDANGQASVTLTPNQISQVPISATVSAIAEGVQGTVSVKFVPPAFPPTDWLTSGALSTSQLTLPLSQYLSIPLGEYNGCIQLHLCSDSLININQLPAANLYLITPVSSSALDESRFVAALSYYFGFSIGSCANSGRTGCVQSVYNPIAVLILELPLTQASNVLFNSNLQLPLPPLCLPQSVAKVFSSSCLQTTPTGNLNLTFIISQNSNTAQFVSNVLQAFESNLASLAKPSVSAALGTFAADLQALLAVGDLTVSVIEADLSQPGSLPTTTLLDLDEVQTAINFVLAAGADMDKAWTIGQSATVFLASRDPVAALQALVTSVDLGVELLPQFVPSLQTNSLYLSFNNYLGLVTTALDPPNAKVLPSYYDSSGSLILGYNAANGTMIYANRNAILFLAGNGYFALLPEDRSNPSPYSETLIASGVGASLPYSVHIRSYNRDQTAQVYSGMLLGGSSVTIPIQFNLSNGALIPQSYLNPSVTEAQTGSGLTIVAKAVLSDGSPSTATNAFLILGGQQYTMIEQDASTFTITVPNSFHIPTTAMIYMISPNTPGGFASVVLGEPPGVHLAARLASLTLDSANDQYVLSLSFINRGADTATDVNLTAAELDDALASTRLPISLGNLPYGASATVTLAFPIGERLDEGKKRLKIRETYAGGAAEQVIRVKLPRPDGRDGDDGREDDHDERIDDDLRQ